VTNINHSVGQIASNDSGATGWSIWIKAAVVHKRVILTSISLRLRIFLLCAVTVALALLEFILSAVRVRLTYQILPLAGVVVVVFLLMRQFQTILANLSAIWTAIEDTARGDFTTPISVNSKDEIGKLAYAVHRMRSQLFDFGRQMFESVRVESLNILGSILAHDMKNFAFRLRSLSSNINNHYADPAFRDSLVRTLDDTTAQMDRMVRRFREQKEVVIVKIRTDLNEVVHSALLKMRRDGARIRISEEYGKLPQVWADAMLIESAFFNLFENAREAMPRGGLIAVRSGVARREENGASFAVVEVADTGPGMSDQFIAKDLFAPFVTTKPRGLGLGLYTCRQIIQMHEGEIKVHSEPGRGTVFSIMLPITE
jgi:signal transduction histidine kinase